MNKRIVMAGTRFDTMGGISSVVNVYRDAGLFERFPIEYLATHCDGGAGRKLGILARALGRYAALLAGGRVGLLHVHMSSRASFWRKCLFLLPAFVLRIPTIVHLHGSEFAVFYERESGRFGQWLVRRVFDSASRVIVLSTNWAAWVRGISHNPAILTLYNPVSWDGREPTRLGRRPGMVLFLGRLGKRKGVYDLLAAARELQARGVDFRLCLGGDGELEEVSRAAKEAGLEGRVELLGWVRGQDKARLLEQAWVYVLPSYHEGLPMSVLEAMAAGLPVISTNIAGIPEAVSDGREGYLLEPGDVAGLADRLQSVLCDEERASRMGHAAWEKVGATFSAETVVPRVEAIYREFGF